MSDENGVIIVSSGPQAVSQLRINVTDDAVYACRWSTAAGVHNDLTCIVSVITGTDNLLSFSLARPRQLAPVSNAHSDFLVYVRH